MLDNSILIDGKDAKTVRTNLEVIQNLNVQIKDMEESVKKAIAEIQAVIGDDAFKNLESGSVYELAGGGSFKVKKASEREDVDKKLLQEKHPDVYKEVMKITFVRGCLDKNSIVL